jgi:hypothetical protein
MPTLDSMSTPDDAATRLSNALDEVFSKGIPDLAHDDSSSKPEPEPTAELIVDAEVETDATDGAQMERVEPVPLPKIVPATVDHPPLEPALPARSGSAAGSGTGIDPTARVTQPVPVPVASTSRSAATSVPEPARAPATAWGDHMTATPVAPGAQLRGPGRRPRVRRVTRVLRHIDPWSTFKVALLFSLVGYVVVLTAGVLLWRVADSTGTLDNVERWFTQFGWETFELKGGEVFHNAWILGLFGIVAVTGGLVLLATLFNLVSDIVGGVRLTVLEEEVVERTVSSTRRYVVRRPPMGDSVGEPAANSWDVDGDDLVDGGGVDRAATPDEGKADTQPATSVTPVMPTGDDWSVDDD